MNLGQRLSELLSNVLPVGDPKAMIAVVGGVVIILVAAGIAVVGASNN